MRLTRISSLPVVVDGVTDPVGTVHDGLLDLHRRRVTYWCVQLKGAVNPVLISVDRTTLDGHAVHISLQREALFETELTGDDLDEDTLSAGPLPDVLVAQTEAETPGRGLGRVWSALERAWRPACPEKPAKAPASWIWGREMTGKPFFSVEGELGRISDIEIDPKDGRIEQIQVAQGGGVTLHINIEALRHVPEGKSHFVARSAYARRKTALPFYRPREDAHMGA